MEINKKAVLSTLAAVGAGAVSTYLTQRGDTSGQKPSDKKPSGDGFDVGSLVDAGSKAAGAIIGSRALGAGGVLGAKLAAAYLANRAVSEAANAGDDQPADDAETGQDELPNAWPILLSIVGVFGLGAMWMLSTRDEDAQTSETATDRTRSWTDSDLPDDATLSEQIREKIGDVDGLSYSVHEGRVTLRGDVAEHRHRAVLAGIGSVTGVRSIDDQLTPAG
ncbi:MAG: BON domain-containing protein [Planctomycetota bacterium]